MATCTVCGLTADPAHSFTECCAGLRRTIAALVPAARLVWEQGGWSGNSGNWPFVDAWGKLEALKTTSPFVFAQLSEKISVPEKTDAPCTLCFGSGKHRGKMVADFQHESFEQGKATAEIITRGLTRKLAAVEAIVADGKLVAGEFVKLVREIQHASAVPAAVFAPALADILTRTTAFLDTIDKAQVK
jgi:hypothetical protein